MLKTSSLSAEKYKIPMVQGGSASDRIFARKFKYIFGTLAPASNYFGSTVDMLKGLNPAPKRRTINPAYAGNSIALEPVLQNRYRPH
jgi:hypothetical protein